MASPSPMRWNKAHDHRDFGLELSARGGDGGVWHQDERHKDDEGADGGEVGYVLADLVQALHVGQHEPLVRQVYHRHCERGRSLRDDVTCLVSVCLVTLPVVFGSSSSSGSMACSSGTRGSQGQAGSTSGMGADLKLMTDLRCSMLHKFINPLSVPDKLRRDAYVVLRCLARPYRIRHDECTGRRGSTI